MRNLAGDKEADSYIRSELKEAGIHIVRGKHTRSEVPYTLTGQLGTWRFERAWYYWMASSNDGEGMPLDIANQLHNKPYPIKGEHEPKTYGKVIRVAGHCGCPPPEEWAFPKEDVLAEELKRMGRNEVTYGDLAKLCNEGKINAPRFVASYHIDSQKGLNEFARTVKSLGIK